MYNKFDCCITDFSDEREVSDYWYDNAVLEAINILKQFDITDWNLLLKDIPNKSLFWKKRLIECLGDLNNPHEFLIILEVISTEDEDLFVDCIDSLRSLDLTMLDALTKDKLLTKINSYLINGVSTPTSKILEDFLKKIGSH